jgi:S1-C subfamily serine protease
VKATSYGRSVLLAATLAAAAAAQRGAPPDEFLQLEPVLQRALAKAAPFTVTVETFGGTRRKQDKEGPMDGEGPPRPRPAPMPPSTPSPNPEQSPFGPDGKPPEGLQPLPDGWKPGDPLPDGWKLDKPSGVPKPIEKDGDKKDADKENEKEKKDDKPKKPLVAEGFQQTQGKTTGIVLTADGWILVSRFALALEPTTVLITVPGRGTFHAQRAGEDTSRGIALVKIDAQGLPVPDFVSPEQVRVGQWAFALGRTFAADEPTVHLGIVSAKRRLFGRALQIDAYTSPANYGGPVVDLDGRVLGIAVPLSPSGRNAGVEWYDSGIGFAATIADAMPLLERMKNGEALQRGWLGVRMAPAHLGPGARIDDVPVGGAAEKAGLAKGDVLLAVDGVDVQHGPHFSMLVSSRLGGDQVTLRVRRASGATETIGPITLLDAPWAEQLQKQEAELPASFPLPEKPEGR